MAQRDAGLTAPRSSVGFRAQRAHHYRLTYGPPTNELDRRMDFNTMLEIFRVLPLTAGFNPAWRSDAP